MQVKLILWLVFVFIQKIFAMNSTKKAFKFTRAVREFHYFQNIWQTKEAKLKYFREAENEFDAYTIKAVVNNRVTVGHLPRVKINLVLSSTHYR